jgi:uncharacterized membrane protein
MSHRSLGTPGPGSGTPAPRRRTGGVWTVIYGLLAVGIVAPLLVFVYDRQTPTLIGFPFYYWFQFAMIPVVSLLTYTAFRLSLRATEKDRSTFGLPTDERPQDRGKDD